MNDSYVSSSLLPVPSQFVRFPPRWRNVLVPARPRRAATLGITLYSASRPLPWLMQSAIWWATALFGARAVPGSREAWAPPVSGDTFDRLGEQWTAALGDRPIGIAVYERLQQARSGLTVLVCGRTRSMLVQARQEEGAFGVERGISDAARSLRPTTIRVPDLIGFGEVAGWHWVGYNAIATRPHRPRYHLESAGHREIAALVESVVPRPADVPSHWRGAHCDLTPWNLRRSRSTTWLIDWEDARWAPPGTDALFLRATVAAMGRRDLARVQIGPDEDEARAFCADIVRSRPSSAAEDHLRVRLGQALAAADSRHH